MIPQENVIGKVIFSLPLVGYISLAVTGSPYGILIILGVILLIILISIPFGEIKSPKDEEQIANSEDRNG